MFMIPAVPVMGAPLPPFMLIRVIVTIPATVIRVTVVRVPLIVRSMGVIEVRWGVCPVAVGMALKALGTGLHHLGRHGVVAGQGAWGAGGRGQAAVHCVGGGLGHGRGVCCPPVCLQKFCHVLTGVVQLVLIQDHVKHFLQRQHEFSISISLKHSAQFHHQHSLLKSNKTECSVNLHSKWEHMSLFFFFLTSVTLDWVKVTKTAMKM